MSALLSPAELGEALQRVVAQDAAALRRVYDATAGRLLAIAQRVLDDRALAEDVLQEAYLSIWNGRRLPPQPCREPLAWLTTLVRHRAIDELRKRRPDLPLQWTTADGEEQQYDVADTTATPPEQIAERQQDERLSHCMGQLADEPRQALMLAYFDGLTHGEIAERIARPLGTVKAWVRRSLMSLQGCLEAAA